MKWATLLLCSFIVLSSFKSYAKSVLHWGSRASYSPDGEKIIFAAELGRKSRVYNESRIYVMDRNGSNIKQLSSDRYSEQLPIYSPDGSKIAFVSQKSEFDDGEIWIMGSDGSNRRQLTNNNFPDSCPAFSLDGTKIVFTRAHQFRPTPWGGRKWGSWAIYLINIDGTEEKRLTNEYYYFLSCPYFSPEGNSILAGVEGALNNHHLKVKYPDGTVCLVDINKGVLVPIGENDDGYPSFSPDGKKIVYQGRPYHREIFIMAADGSNRKQITKNQIYNAHPIFSPDGSKILFLSDPEREDDWGLYEVNVDGSNLHRIPVNLEETKRG